MMTDHVQSSINDGQPVRFCGSGPGIRDAAVIVVLRAAFFVVNHTVRRGHYTTCRMLGTLASSGAYAEFIAPGGGRFRAHPRDGYWMRSLFVQRRYEPELLPIVDRAVQVGMPFLDCGANLGWWAVIAGSAQQGPPTSAGRRGLALHIPGSSGQQSSKRRHLPHAAGSCLVAQRRDRRLC